MKEILHSKRAYTSESIGINSLTVHYFGFETCTPLHTWSGKRDHYLLHYVISGKGSFTSNNQIRQLEKGHAFLARVNTPVAFEADFNDPWEYCWVGFNGSEIPYLLSKTGFAHNNDSIQLRSDSHEEIINIFNNFFENQGNSLVNRLELLRNLYALIILLVQQEEKQSEDFSTNESLLINVTEFINANMSNCDLSVLDLAKHVGFSQSSLYRLFMSNLGIPPMKYIIELRMKRSCELMRTTKMSITEVSYSVGFSNSLYFSKYFKKYFNMSPRNFIKNYANVKHPLEIDVFRPHVP